MEELFGTTYWYEVMLQSRDVRDEFVELAIGHISVYYFFSPIGLFIFIDVSLYVFYLCVNACLLFLPQKNHSIFQLFLYILHYALSLETAVTFLMVTPEWVSFTSPVNAEYSRSQSQG